MCKMQLFKLNALFLHLFQCLPMPLGINISDGFRKEPDLESCLHQILASISDTILCGDSTYIDILDVEQFQDLRKRLTTGIYSFKSGILLLKSVASLVESQTLIHIWAEQFVDFPSACPGDAMRRPDTAEILERRMVLWMSVTDKEDGEGA